MRRIAKTISALLLAMTLCSCGSSSYSSDYDSGSYAGASADYEMMDYYAADELGYAPAMQAKTANGSGRTNNSETATESDAKETSEKLVYRGSVNLETLKYEETVKAVREKISEYKGIIEQENSWDNDDSWTYTDGRKRTKNRTLSLTLRIPTESFQSFMNDMEGTAKVTSKSQSVENISRRYNDNSIEIEALRVQQERLLKMMDEAETVEEMIMVEERLSEVQTSLNQKLSYQSSMDKDVQYSTISLNVNEVQEYTPAKDELPVGNFGKRFVETVKDSCEYFIYFLQNLLLFLIRIFPFAVVIGLIAYLIRKYRKKKGLNPNPFAKKPEKDWKAYADEKRAQLAAKKEAEKLEKEIDDKTQEGKKKDE